MSDKVLILEQGLRLLFSRNIYHVVSLVSIRIFHVHSSCIVVKMLPKNVYVIYSKKLTSSNIHNLNLIVKSLKSQYDKVTVIPQNLEKYLSLSVGKLKFIDSFQFTPKSLDVLSKTLEDDEFRYLVESCATSHFELIRRKGVYPYDYMDSFSRFEETSLPTEEDFFN